MSFQSLSMSEHAYFLRLYAFNQTKPNPTLQLFLAKDGLLLFSGFASADLRWNWNEAKYS